ncbi:hypothetical protein K6119_05895 [Paracrocinitomix mangrovi]|uniref:hypothetical protein n=1 Tax=Paracrocinitomix mangrovi TaxID=2862509 RepID=UPI001C8EFE1E|nr:hypothetical protein [Paracrocinitomix mangrovi]UKN03042.1 hypothetical protein K6119_05895 [Paracrocinitomix mangrovi]
MLVLLITFTNSFSQDDVIEQRFFFGVNVGVKFANKNYANRYGGWYQDKLDYTLNLQQNYLAIYEILGQKDFFLDYDGFPTIVRYQPGLLTGVTMGFKVSPNLQAGIDADFSKLKVNSGYTIQVIDPSQTISQEQYRTGYITAEESRFNGRFNLDYIIEGNDKINYVAGISGLFMGWRIDKHIAFYETYQMSLFSVHDPTNNFTAKTGGVGWGVGANAGIEYRFNDKIVAQIMYQPYLQKAEYFSTKSDIANLGSAYVKPSFRLEHDLTVRILWK